MTLKMAAHNGHLEAEHGTELKLMWCLQRRGLAFDQADLISWHKHELWVSTLFQAYSADPPPHFSHVSLAQLIRADREMFTLLSRECDAIQPLTDGTKPLDGKITELRTDPRVTMHLLPIPNVNKMSTGPASSSKGEAATGKQAQAKQKSRPGKRARETNVKMPDELAGCYPKTVDNKPICWAYNMQGCSMKSYGYHQRAYCSKLCGSPLPSGKVFLYLILPISGACQKSRKNRFCHDI